MLVCALLWLDLLLFYPDDYCVVSKIKSNPVKSVNSLFRHFTASFCTLKYPLLTCVILLQHLHQPELLEESQKLSRQWEPASTLHKHPPPHFNFSLKTATVILEISHQHFEPDVPTIQPSSVEFLLVKMTLKTAFGEMTHVVFMRTLFFPLHLWHVAAIWLKRMWHKSNMTLQRPHYRSVLLKKVRTIWQTNNVLMSVPFCTEEFW